MSDTHIPDEDFPDLPTDWKYEHTHYSKRDGSPAMLWAEDPFLLINEEGFVWADDRNDWGSYDEIDWDAVNAVMES